jgi:CPA2 family monovalent cation:H+ antiporter-2
MGEHGPLPYLREVLLFFALAGVLIPLLQRLRVNAVLGFLAVGALLGPFGLGRLSAQQPWLQWLTIPRIEGVTALAEVGVLFLMFMIGLDLSTERLWAMRRWVFGAGAAQVIVCTLAVGLVSYGWGNSLETSVVLGLVLSFSSTAVVMQLLVTRRIGSSQMGRATFAVLLFQDLAVAPVLILVGVLSSAGAQSIPGALGVSLLKALVAIGLILWVGRKGVAPLFRRIAADRQPDVLVALTLLATLGIAALTYFAGLSMALGAFLAGLLLAETEYRHEVEVTIEPFRGLLMGIFFLSVGMTIDPLALLHDPFWLPMSVVGLFLVKGLLTAMVLRAAGLPLGAAAEAGLLLGQGGEFAFIVVGAAMLSGLIPLETGKFMMLTVGLSMMATPLVATLAHGAGARLAERRPIEGAGPTSELPSLEGLVLVAGFGRVGQLIGRFLDEQRLPYVAVDPDPVLVASMRARGAPVFVGDAGRTDLLRAVGLRRASLVVLTMDDPAAASRAAAAIRREVPEMPVLARARDERHAAELVRAGASFVIPEALEAGLQLAGAVVERCGVPREAVELLQAQERSRRLGFEPPTLGPGRRDHP